MNQFLSAIRESSRGLLDDAGLSIPVRKLACTVLHGADLIDRYQLDGLPQFERALFHLCHVGGRPLCGETICRGLQNQDNGACERLAIAPPTKLS
jgi:hypothetical protein